MTLLQIKDEEHSEGVAQEREDVNAWGERKRFTEMKKYLSGQPSAQNGRIYTSVQILDDGF